MNAAMLRMPHHGWAAERCSHRLSQVSKPPGAYGGMTVKVCSTTDRSYSWAAAQYGSKSGWSNGLPYGAYTKMPQGQDSFLQRSISAKPAWISRPDRMITPPSRC